MADKSLLMDGFSLRKAAPRKDQRGPTQGKSAASPGLDADGRLSGRFPIGSGGDLLALESGVPSTVRRAMRALLLCQDGPPASRGLTESFHIE
jgi:hypothetical protein